ncbi:dephospho-CoA kinase [Cyclonatronum proteinivorum]|uniref:Dephospho-CoA kinase n=2 Tax=Cyclonatronum proteinivorum TaxID=1457365 RepID=A0A345ULM9_9BACT|nr:dephospho-CoA kinase [Cyclonatronum proteinivorum]
MKLVGLTGGIGSGKTTVAKIWADLGAFVMDADQTAKTLMTTDPELIAGLKAAFGEAVYTSDGSLNRPYLAQEAFEKGRVEELNRLVHPAVYRETDRLIGVQREKGTPVFVKEAALLLKHGRPAMLDVVVLCEAGEAVRKARVQARDGHNEAHISQRMAQQKGLFEALDPQRDIIIENNGTREELHQKARAVWAELIS